MAPTKPRPPETLQERRARQAIEGVAAMRDYRAREAHLVKTTARLRAERLARETAGAAAQDEAPSVRDVAPPARKRKG